MARKSRDCIPGALYHVMLRGNNGQPVFMDDVDRERFGWLAAEGVRRYRHRIHAFCWMNNHVHLALQCGEASLSEVVQNLAFRYAANFNRRHGRVGHVFQGRFKAIHVNADAYLLELVRYIHLNPVRANLCETAGDYAWSGHRAYLGETACPWLRTDWVLSMFSVNAATAREQYRDFVWHGRKEKRHEEFYKSASRGLAPVDIDFAHESMRDAPASMIGGELGARTISHLVCDLAGEDASALLSMSRSPGLNQVRHVAAYLARANKVCTLAQLVPLLGRDRTTLSRASMAFRDKRVDLPTLALLSKVEHFLSAATHV